MEEDKVKSSTTDLVNAVRDLFEAETAKDMAKAPQLKRALALMQELRLDSERPAAKQLPGCRHLSRTLDLGEAGPAAAVATAIRDLEPTLAWAQNPRYNAVNKGAYFMDNYAWSGLGLTGSSAMAAFRGKISNAKIPNPVIISVRTTVGIMPSFWVAKPQINFPAAPPP